MNKAFLREPERTADYCPRCGSQGEPVGRETLQEFLTEAQRRSLAEPANFCPSPQCDVVYFDSFERSLLTGDLPRPVYPKDPAAPLCACLGLTAEDIGRASPLCRSTTCNACSGSGRVLVRFAAAANVV
ncbi:MAG: hypothetical protein MUF25_07825 [Pirellulaceae bacterium]|nr:hypothetical protein [Pirellulaceae bacterium]